MRPLGYPHVEHLSEKRQRGLRAFWLDGLYSSLAGGFADPYYALYMLSLSASNAQIGLVNTLSQLAGATLAVPGAAIADRTGHYRQVALIAGAVARLMWLVMLAAPFLLPDAGAVWLVLVAWVAIAGAGAMGNAAWTALSAELVPGRLRGGYFASRNIVMQLVRLAAIPLAGQLVNAVGEPLGYQINLGVAFVIAAIGLYFFSTLPEHLPKLPGTVELDRFNLRAALRQIREMSTFKRFMTSHAILTFGVMLGGPFIAVYQAQELDFSTGTIGLVTTAGVLASLIGMRVMGRLHDRFGIVWTMRFGIGVPLITVLWLWVQTPVQAYIVSVFAAFTWAGYNLGAFNLMLAATPDEHRPHYIAINTTVISLVGACGPLLGGWLLDEVGFVPVFSLSTALRLLGLLAFFVLVREPEPPPDSAESGDD